MNLVSIEPQAASRLFRRVWLFVVAFFPLLVLSSVGCTPSYATDISPDLTKIVFSDSSASTDGKSKILVRDVDSLTSSKVVGNVPGVDCRWETWSPDSKRIAFTSNDYYHDEQVWVVDADGQNQIQVSNVPEGRNSTPVWSPDSKKIAFANDFGGGRIFVVDADGNNQIQVTNPTNNYVMWPQWSPDGKKVLLESRGDKSQIFVIDLSSQNPDKQVSNLLDDTGYKASQARWSPDGTKIAFSNFREGVDPEGQTEDISEQTGVLPRGLTRDIFVVDVDGQNQTQISDVPNTLSDNPLWSPDSERIAFTNRSHEGDYAERIFVVDADGKNQTQISGDPGALNEWVWSPDRKKIALRKKEDWLDGRIFVVDADGKNQTQIIDLPGYSIHPHWSPDSRKLVFMNRERGSNEYRRVFAVDADGQNIVDLSELQKEDQQDRSQKRLNALVQRGITTKRTSTKNKVNDKLTAKFAHPFNTLKCVNRACYRAAEGLTALEQANSEKAKNAKLTAVLMAFANSTTGLVTDVGSHIAEVFPSTWWDRYVTGFALTRFKKAIKEQKEQTAQKIRTEHRKRKHPRVKS